jgi:dTDP-4-amino-4,6-dideoxygalactose transaminase
VKAAQVEVRIPFFRYPHLFLEHREAVQRAVIDVMERGAYILQRDLARFEDRLATLVGVRHAIGVANGTDALMLALRAAGVEPGSEVIVPSHTYVASAASIHYVGAVPVLVECGADHLVDPESVEAAVTPRTAAVMPVQLNGRVCDMDALAAIADRHGLVIVEDAAQGLGAQFRGRAAGAFGTSAGFSFYPAKVLGCFGDGGAVTTNDDSVAESVSLLRDHGRNEEGEVVTWGVNSRLDNLQAAILNVKLDVFSQDLERRRATARLYRQGLDDVAELVLPPGPDGDPDHFDVYQNYEVEADMRDALREHLGGDGIGTILQWGGKPVHQFEGLGFSGYSLPDTDRLFERCFLLPMNTSLTDDEVHYICASVRRFYGYPV